MSPTSNSNSDQTQPKSVSRRPLPQSFTSKKEGILKALDAAEGEYEDKSPKGSVDAGVLEVLELVNGFEGWVSTSSCAGRGSVFVEGRKAAGREGDGEGEGDGGEEIENGELLVDGVDGTEEVNGEETAKKKVRTGPGGKGGGKWLYVSHDPIDTSSTEGSESYFTNLFGLEPMSSSSTILSTKGQSPRLIHLSFSPLILHILTASLHHARPLLSAAINAGFRESGVQSLKALEDDEAGVMIAIRTAGLVFSSAIGVVVEDENGEERYQSIVSEEYLRMCVGVINERFEWNEVRKGRLVGELQRVLRKESESNGEGEEERRRRKKEEGLKVQQETRQERMNGEEKGEEDDVLEDGLDLPAMK